jgi:hypothetical protein
MAMNVTQIGPEFLIGNTQLTVALVTEVRDDGSVSVTNREDGAAYRCAVLQSSDTSSLLLSDGDTVLIWQWPAGSDHGVILGRIRPTQATAPEPRHERETVPDEIVIEAKKNLTLKCGEGSITIRQDGKILIKGKDLVSHAQRMNRIKGGSVSIN